MTRAATQPTKRAAPSLAAAPATGRPAIDRQHQPWVPLYIEFLRVQEDKNGHLGHGLRPGPAILLAILIHRQGSPLDGRRASRDERDGADHFIPRKSSAGDLCREFGWSYDQVQSWSEELARPTPCGYCRRGHPLVAIDRRPGCKNSFRLIRCGDVADSDCLELKALTRYRRPKHGGRATGREGQPDLGIDPPVAEAPSEKVRRFGGGDQPPSTIEEKRVLALAAIALLEDVDVPPEVFATIAAAVDSNDVAELRDSLLRVVALAGVRHQPITPGFAQAVIREGQPSEKIRRLTAVPSNDAGGDPLSWALGRILELARRREPETTHGQAIAYRNELVAAITQRFGEKVRDSRAVDPEILERELQRILTDPRICGRIGNPQMNPIAMLRDGLRNGWLWIAAENDDGSGRFARAFRKLSPGAQVEIRKIFEQHKAGEPLPNRTLAELGVTSPGMIAWLNSTT